MTRETSPGGQPERRPEQPRVELRALRSQYRATKPERVQTLMNISKPVQPATWHEYVLLRGDHWYGKELDSAVLDILWRHDGIIRRCLIDAYNAVNAARDTSDASDAPGTSSAPGDKGAC
jgi:hypothetical protein